jgi:hypothetical protein
LRHDPAAGAKQVRDLAEGPYRIGLVHQEKPRISEVERAAHRRRVELVDVTSKHLHVAQLQRGHNRPGALDGWLAEVDANDPPRRAHHLCHDGKPANRAAAAVDGMPAFLHTGPAEGRTGHPLGSLSEAQQPPEIFIAAIEDVAPDPVRDRFSHDQPLCRREPVRACCVRPVPSVKSVSHTGLIQHRRTIRLAQASGRPRT